MVTIAPRTQSTYGLSICILISPPSQEVIPLLELVDIDDFITNLIVL